MNTKPPSTHWPPFIGRRLNFAPVGAFCPKSVMAQSNRIAVSKPKKANKLPALLPSGLKAFVKELGRAIKEQETNTAKKWRPTAQETEEAALLAAPSEWVSAVRKVAGLSPSRARTAVVSALVRVYGKAAA